MPDTSIPSFVVLPEKQIHITIDATQATSEDQGYTYNQAGFTYNQAGVYYGGLINVNEDIAPSLFSAEMQMPSMIIDKTDAFSTDQGYTYNQPLFTYNQLGIEYGGLNLTNQDMAPLLETARFVFPSIISIEDIYTPAPPPPSGNSGMLIGMLGLTYP